jgi:[ribosomal protein S5]-alanine N-acetyltransferase
MSELRLSVPGVAIVAATLASFDMEERDVATLAEALGTAPPVAWPPEHNGQPYRDWQRALFARFPHEPGFAGWYIIGDGELVGTCGFKGPPDPSGTVEIGYSVIEPRRRRGYASGAVRLLLQYAFADSRIGRVVAETLPDLVASQGVLIQCGFASAGTRIDADDGEVLSFERKR